MVENILKSPHAPNTANVELLKTLASERFSCRAFLPEPVPDDVIEGIVDIARRTASWCNVQPWQVYVTRGETTTRFRDQLVEQASLNTEVDSDLPFPPSYEGIYKQRRRESGYQLYNALGIEKEDWDRRKAQASENFRLFGAPHAAIITTPAAIGPYGTFDCGAFVGMFLLAARAHGVATIPQASLARHCTFTRSFFDIPEDQNIVCGISMGYADVDHAANSYRTTRAEVNEVVQLV